MVPATRDGEPISTFTPLMPTSIELAPRVIVPVEVFVFWIVKTPPVDCTNVPEPTVSVEPEVINDKLPVAVILLLVVIPPAALSVKLTMPPVDIPLPVRAVESVKVTLLVVLNVILGVARFAKVITPEPLVKATDVVPVSTPEPVMCWSRRQLEPLLSLRLNCSRQCCRS